MQNKLHVRKGDLVQVLSGEDKGKSGKILEVLPKKGRVVVEGINIIKKHTRPTLHQPTGWCDRASRAHSCLQGDADLPQLQGSDEGLKAPGRRQAGRPGMQAVR